MARLWFKPVDIWLSISVRKTVTSVEEAARILLDMWPEEEEISGTRVAAMEACQAAINSSALQDIEVARNLFIAAAEDADMT